jgi:lactoylglutathione lyase
MRCGSKLIDRWYEKVLGMEVSRTRPCQGLRLLTDQKFYESGGSDFTNFFLAFPSGFPDNVKTDEDKKNAFKNREGILELCWNHGTGTH